MFSNVSYLNLLSFLCLSISSIYCSGQSKTSIKEKLTYLHTTLIENTYSSPQKTKNMLASYEPTVHAPKITRLHLDENYFIYLTDYRRRISSDLRCIPGWNQFSLAKFFVDGAMLAMNDYEHENEYKLIIYSMAPEYIVSKNGILQNILVSLKNNKKNSNKQIHSLASQLTIILYYLEKTKHHVDIECLIDPDFMNTLINYSSLDTLEKFLAIIPNTISKECKSYLLQALQTFDSTTLFME